MPVLPPLNAFIELIVFFAVVLFFDAVLQFFPDLNEIKPHPFWFPVLLLSLQYGTVSGLLAAGVSILITTVLGWPEQDIGENHFNFLIRIWAEPVLWIVVALVLGQFRMRQIAQRRALLRKVNRLQTQRDAIEQHSTNLRGRCEMLERRIASQQANTVPELFSTPSLNWMAQGRTNCKRHFPSRCSWHLVQDNIQCLPCRTGNSS